MEFQGGTAVINVMIELFIIMILGYILAKKNILDKEISSKISWLVVNVSLPMIIVASVYGKEGSILDVMDYFLAGIVFYAVVPVIAFLICKILKIKKENMGIYQFMLIFSNCSFMGYPVLKATFGDEAIFLSSIFNLPFNIVAFSYGVYLISSNGENNKFQPKKLLNVGIIASILALVIYTCHIKLPTVIIDTCNMFGDITTPLSMIVLGISLAQVPIKDLFCEYKIYPITIIRLIVIPLLTYFIMSKIFDNQMLIGIATGTAAMPVATMCVMLANQYKGDEKLASIGVVISTLCSIITIPFIMGFLFG